MARVCLELSKEVPDFAFLGVLLLEPLELVGLLPLTTGLVGCCFKQTSSDTQEMVAV